jgi:hypothetical protein
LQRAAWYKTVCQLYLVAEEKLYEIYEKYFWIFNLEVSPGGSATLTSELPLTPPLRNLESDASSSCSFMLNPFSLTNYLDPKVLINNYVELLFQINKEIFINGAKALETSSTSLHYDVDESLMALVKVVEDRLKTSWDIFAPDCSSSANILFPCKNKHLFSFVSSEELEEIQKKLFLHYLNSFHEFIEDNYWNGMMEYNREWINYADNDTENSLSLFLDKSKNYQRILNDCYFLEKAINGISIDSRDSMVILAYQNIHSLVQQITSNCLDQIACGIFFATFHFYYSGRDNWKSIFSSIHSTLLIDIIIPQSPASPSESVHTPHSETVKSEVSETELISFAGFHEVAVVPAVQAIAHLTESYEQHREKYGNPWKAWEIVLEDLILNKLLSFYFLFLNHLIQMHVNSKELSRRVLDYVCKESEELAKRIAEVHFSTRNETDEVLSNSFPLSFHAWKLLKNLSLLLKQKFSSNFLLGAVEEISSNISFLHLSPSPDIVNHWKIALTNFVSNFLLLRNVYEGSLKVTEIEHVVDLLQKKLNQATEQTAACSQSLNAQLHGYYDAIYHSFRYMNDGIAFLPSHHRHARNSIASPPVEKLLLTEVFLTAVVSPAERSLVAENLVSPTFSASVEESHTTDSPLYEMIKSRSQQNNSEVKFEQYRKSLPVAPSSIINRNFQASQSLSDPSLTVFFTLFKLKINDLFYLYEERAFNLFVVIQVDNYRTTTEIKKLGGVYNEEMIEKPIQIPVYLNNSSNNNGNRYIPANMEREMILSVVVVPIAAVSLTAAEEIVIGYYRFAFHLYHLLPTIEIVSKELVYSKDPRVQTALQKIDIEKRKFPKLSLTMAAVSLCLEK